MQVSPDNNVRITETSPIGRIPVSPEHAAGLKNGDFLVATVEQVHGDTLLLRLDGDFLLNAALQGNMQLIRGDVIEAAVSKDGGTCLLYIVNVLHAGGQAPKDAAAFVSPQTLSAMLSVIKRNPGLDADIALFLAQNNIPDTAENIAALSQMSRGTGIGALLGRVLALMAQPEETSQAVSPESLIPAGDTALSQGEPMTAGPETLPEGGQSQPAPTAQGQAAANGDPPVSGTPAQIQPPGSNPQAAAAETALTAPGVPHTESQQAAAVPAQTQESGTQTANSRPDAVPAPQAGQTPVSQGAGQSAAPGLQTVNTAAAVQIQTAPRQDAAGAAQPQTAPRQDATGTASSQSSPWASLPDAYVIAADRNAPYDARNIAAQPAVQREAPPHTQTEGTPPAPILPGGSEGQTGKTDMGLLKGSDEQIGRVIKGLFLQPQDRTGEELKKTANEMSRGLKTLKSELIQTDNKYRELCLKSVDQALRQIELADRTAHFEHMQIPIAVKEGEHRTAELYVFRRKNGNKSAAEAGRSILVALDTDRMGRVETLIREESGSISLEFRLQRPDMTEIFKKNSGPLKEAVEAAGYKLSGMRFAGLEKKTTVLNAGEIVPPDAGSAPHGIDVQI